MSQMRAMDILREYHHAWSRGDVEAGCSYFADDLIVHMGGTHPILSRDFVGGRDFVENWVNRVAAYTDSWIVGGEAGHDEVLVEADDAVLLMVHEIWTRGDKRVHTDRLATYRFKDGKIVECWFSDMRQAEVDAFFADMTA